MSQHAVIKRNGKWIVRGLNTGRILGTHSRKDAADRQLRAIEWSMHGAERRHKRRGAEGHRRRLRMRKMRLR